MPVSFISRWIFLLVLFSLQANAFVIINHDYRLGNPKNTSVYIVDGGCPGIGNDELQSAVEDVINRYWNTVSESSLRMKYGGLTTNTTADPGTVIVSCAPLTGASGVASPNIDNGSTSIRLDSNSFVPGGYYYEGLVGVLAHEMGHAVGLAHSFDSASVMTYNSHGWGPSPKYLSQDDKDGVIYLYPNDKQLSGLLGGCAATAASQNPQAAKSGFNITDFILFTLLLIAVLKVLVATIPRRTD